MKYLFFSFLIFCVFFSCKNETRHNASKIEEPLIMAKQSEMALLMNQMYLYNESLKHQIAKDTLVSEFPDFFTKIHNAELTDPSDRDEKFKVDAAYFLKSQKELFDNSSVDLKTKYNNAVNACISCHSETCVGPIPRIKKLLIK